MSLPPKKLRKSVFVCVSSFGMCKTNLVFLFLDLKQEMSGKLKFLYPKTSLKTIDLTANLTKQGKAEKILI